ncbi:MAG: sigma-70 family RNA polymerase sigma factor [Clostridium sp.]|nr:sigma-70 family RNA polymerase sigma factor [Clostridium sp.]
MPFNENDMSAIDINVRRAKLGDKEAFKKLIQENKSSMYRVSKAILKEEEDIEDAIGEAILKAYRNIGFLRNEIYFKTWLIRIVINESNNIYKKRNREIAMDKEYFINMEYRDSYKDFSLYDAINSLEDNLRITTLLYYFEDLKYKDIAELLNVREGTVKSRLSRAKQKLYEILKDN